MDVIWVDENNKEIGQGPIKAAIDHGITTRVSRVFIFNTKGEMLLQKRSKHMFSFPNMWDQSAAGHVDVGETYEDAAYREMKEEMGIKNIELEEMCEFKMSEDLPSGDEKKTFNMIFKGFYDSAVNIDPAEVSDYKWLSIDQILDAIQKHPKHFTPGFVISLKEYIEATKLQR